MKGEIAVTTAVVVVVLVVNRRGFGPIACPSVYCSINSIIIIISRARARARDRAHTLTQFLPIDRLEI